MIGEVRLLRKSEKETCVAAINLSRSAGNRESNFKRVPMNSERAVTAADLGPQADRRLLSLILQSIGLIARKEGIIESPKMTSISGWTYEI